MHKTFISYHHAGEQDLKEAIIRKGVAGGEFIDKSVSDGDINTDLSEDTIMRKIRSEYIQDSTVVVVLIGEDTTQRPYVNSEIQAALWSNPTGLIGVVRDELYDKVYTKKKNVITKVAVVELHYVHLLMNLIIKFPFWCV